MNAYSFEKNNINEIINNYTVSDKADGERYFVFIHNENVYLISNTMNVKKINEKLHNLSNLNNTILDGEYIYSKLHNKYILYLFDILYHKGVDIRDNDLNKRFNLLLQTINDLYEIN
jgi:ATP-dependent DNA ligase